MLLWGLLVYSVAATTRAESWKYTEEALTVEDMPCINDCVNNECIYNWEGTKKPCRRLHRPPPLFHTSRKNDDKSYNCVSNCGTFGNPYEKCITTNGWDYCNSDVRNGSKTIFNAPCLGVCSRDTTSYYWCYTKYNSWEYCAPPAEPRLPNSDNSGVSSNIDALENGMLRIKIDAQIPKATFETSGKSIYFVFNIYNNASELNDVGPESHSNNGTQGINGGENENQAQDINNITSTTSP